MRLIALLLVTAHALNLKSDPEKLVPEQERIVIAVPGIEGTGHHYFDQVFRVMSATIISLQGNWIWSQMEKEDQSWSPEHIDTNAMFLENTLANHPGEVIAISATKHTSFPSGHGNHISRMFHRQPNISLLMEAAKKAQVELRLLVTNRDAVETLVATCKHRLDLESCALQAETLAWNAQVLKKQLLHLDPKSIRCVNYGDLLDLGLGLASVVRDDVSEAAKLAVKKAWYGEDHHDDLANSADIISLAQKMHGPVSDLAEGCKAAERRASEENASDDNAVLRVERLLNHILPKAIAARSKI